MKEDQQMKQDRVEYSWQEALLEAFLSDQEELAGKIDAAEKAILARLRERETVSPTEYVALDDALRSLRVLLADVESQKEAPSDGQKSERSAG